MAGHSRCGRRVRALALIAIPLCAAGCLHAARLRPQTHFVQLADALTAPTLSEAIRVAPVKMTSFQFVDACRTATPIARFELAPAALQMNTGSRYALDTLSVVGVNAANLAVPGIPFVIEAEELPVPVIALRSDDADVRSGVLRAVAPGRFKVRIRTTCGMPYVEAILVGRVVDPVIQPATTRQPAP
jgi:hypothetical protein